MSELLDRIENEIRERLAATRAAVQEHERLQAALHALGGAGAEAARAVKERASGRGSSKRVAGTPDTAAAPSSRAPTRAAGAPTAPTAPTARRAASTKPRSRSSAAPGKPSSRRPASAPKASGPQAGAKPERRRAPRGANREAVLRVVAERPGVTSRELAAASGVQGGTLSALLRTLVSRGELEKRSLPGGRTGYALAQSVPAGDTPTAKPAGETAKAAGDGATSASDRGDAEASTSS